ncbi:piggyBac transposable element-derived protein 4-like [Melitaea cinxia]|uniref:piggyBac transposable element-derived protein 4-like n=1 Tax=Melitaea cinxia TaxID=113334 RepID=UPI001E27461D|nr:piggyBac transposable element-derived protein 4-like [Melitaea cinxia]
MASKRWLTEDNITQLLMDEEDPSALEESSNSETEDNLEVDDAESDAQDEVSDHENISSLDLNDNVPEPEIPSTLSEEGSGNNSAILTLPQQNIRSQSRHVWTTSKGRTSSRAAAINIVRVARGPTRGLRGIEDPLLLFEHFITNQMQEDIVKWTNAEITIKRQNYEQNTSTQNETTKEEIRALIGILVLSAALKDNHLSLDELFNTEYSGSRYVSCMSKERCDFLLRCLRFDDKTFRLQRQKDDPFTPIRDLWEMLMVQCRQNYVPGTNVTIDEQLLAFRGRCKFRMYIPNKPAKYGVKLEMLCDSGTRYMIDSTPYLGKGTNTRGVPLGEYFVKELTRSIHGTNRNVTMDNWFTSVPLAKQLLQQPYKMTLVGTLRANKKEIPEEMKNYRSRAVNTSMFCYDGPLTLLSYKVKPSKMVYLLSSCDEDGTVDPHTKKPHMVQFYNSTKGGVDTFDQMCSVMSCSRKTSRWPLCVFYGMLNISCINSYIIYCHNTCVIGQKVITRRDFMKKLHMQLVESWLKTRLEIRTMPRHVKDKIKNVLGVSIEEGQGQPSSSNNDLQPLEAVNRKRKICGLCSYKKRRMTKCYCSKCNTAICGEHKVDFCVQCASK